MTQPQSAILAKIAASFDNFAIEGVDLEQSRVIGKVVKLIRSFDE